MIDFYAATPKTIKIPGQEQVESNGNMVAEFGTQYGLCIIPTLGSRGCKFPGGQPIKEELTAHSELQHGRVPPEPKSHFIHGLLHAQLRNVRNVTELPLCQMHGGKLSLLFSWLR